MSTTDLEAFADQVAQHIANYLDGLERVALGDGEEGVVPFLLLEVSQISFIGAQLGANEDVVPEGNIEPPHALEGDVDALRQGLAARLADVDDYVEVFDPFSKKPELEAYRLSDDLADIAADLTHGLRHYEEGNRIEALWWWQYSYFNHWGNHAGAALRALQAVVAHARLDVAEDLTVEAADEVGVL
ncbi:MAG: DUF5063 domain-containing protein [Streptosporangiales bacterium]|nr:DUF5063 domain-containing protein [Streptosporangiales bacterium]